MVNLKNITDVPMAESAEGLNLIVNDNGVAKQIPANMLSDINAKVSALEAAVDALTPIVVNVTGNGKEAPVVDKTFDEILALLQSGNRVEFHVVGHFKNDNSGFAINYTLQPIYFADDCIACGAVCSQEDSINVYSLKLYNFGGLIISIGDCRCDDYNSFVL